MPAVIDVSFELAAGETLGLVGESGSGKSVTALSILRLVQPPGRIAGGRDRLQGPRPAARCREREMQRVRGAEIALIFQEPMTALNPVFTIGDQIAETLRRARPRDAADSARQGDRAARAVQHPGAGAPRARLPASALRRHAPARADRDGARVPAGAGHRRRADDRARRHHPGADPRPAARDEAAARPRRCCSSRTTSASSPEMADRVAVMYAGRIVEEAPVRAIFRRRRRIPTRAACSASMPGGAPGTRLRAIAGTVPLLGALPPGCAFTPRCPVRFEPCPTAPSRHHRSRRRPAR